MIFQGKVENWTVPQMIPKTDRKWSSTLNDRGTVQNPQRTWTGLLQRTVLKSPYCMILGNLSNDDVDVNENGKKAIGLDWQNNNFARASCFFVHFFAVSARLRRETA